VCVKKDTYTCVNVCVCEERCVGAWVCGRVGACVCMHVCARERERERDREKEKGFVLSECFCQ